MNMISTGAFQTEMTPYNKQRELVNKLVSAWEKKNSKVTRAGGVSLMALTLAACGGEDDTPFSQVDLDAASAAASAAAVGPALTAADGVTTYTSVDAAYAAGAASVDVTSDNATVIAAAEAVIQASLDTLQATYDALVVSNNALVASNATLQASYDALVAPTVDALAVAGAETLVGSAGNDSFSGTTAFDDAADNIVDSSTTDNDTLTMTLTADMPAITVSNVENVILNTSALVGVELDVSGITNGTTTVNLTGVGSNGIAHVDLLTASNTLVAGTGVTTLQVDNAATGSTITAGAETTNIDVDAAATAASVTINTSATLVDVDNANFGTGGQVVDALTINYAADTDVVIDAIGTSLTVTGDTGSLSATSAILNAETVTDSTTGTFSVDVDITGSHDLSSVSTDRFDVVYTATGTLTMADTGVSMQIDEDFGAAVTFDGTTGTEASNSISAVVSVAALSNANFTDFRTVTISADEDTTITSLSIEATNNLVVTGGNDLTFATDVTALAIDGSGSTGDNSYTVTATETITGGAGADTIDFNSGGTQDATATTNAGNDSVDVTDAQVDGDVVIDLGAGNDSANAGNQMSSLTVTGGAGNDTVTLAQASYAAVTMSMTGVEILSFTTGGATTLESSFMSGSSFVLSGNSAAADVTIDMDSATLDASGLTSDSTIGITNTVGNIAGIALTLTGSDYNDVLAGDNVADAITGGLGDDTIDAGAGADQVTGGSGVDDIDGDGGADVIDGGAGGDTLDGGDGIDTITTGAGADTVTFNTQTSLANALAARDTITDFTAGASGDTYDYDGATANVTTVVGSTGNSVQAHSATGNLTITAAAEVVNITVEDVATLTTDGEAVLNALVSGTGNSGTITTANAGEVKLITISDGTSTGIYIGAPGAGNTDIAQAEMALIATLTGVDNADLVAGNFDIV